MNNQSDSDSDSLEYNNEGKSKYLADENNKNVLAEQVIQKMAQEKQHKI